MDTHTYNKRIGLNYVDYGNTVYSLTLKKEKNKANEILQMIGAKDSDTLGHCFRVARITEKLCNELKLEEPEKTKIVIAALIHDAGKIKIPDKILKKPSKLTDKEFEIMKKHTFCTFLLPDFEPEIIDIIESHHERFNGTGYPCHLMGKEIPFGARIIAIADSIDAMRSKRCYKPEMDDNFIKEELERNSGTAYDPDLVKVALNIWPLK